jgi:putative component of membrane protein insertase Oxa1/YidC/SpoIIIJ protein YidD
LRRVALYVIGIYQRDVASGLATACPFTPTCSEYGRLAYERYSFTRATWKTVGRLRRCRRGYAGPLVDPP